MPIVELAEVDEQKITRGMQASVQSSGAATARIAPKSSARLRPIGRGTRVTESRNRPNIKPSRRWCMRKVSRVPPRPPTASLVSNVAQWWLP